MTLFVALSFNFKEMIQSTKKINKRVSYTPDENTFLGTAIEERVWVTDYGTSLGIYVKWDQPIQINARKIYGEFFHGDRLINELKFL